MSISSKEARETLFWLQLLDKSQMVKYDYKPFIINCKELVKMLTSIVKTTQIKLTAENQKLKTKH